MRNCFLLVFALAAAAPAWATLGGPPSSVATDAANLHASAPTSVQHGAYTTMTFTLPSGIVVKEFANDTDVFAVSWRGPRAMSMSALLGDQYAGYRAKRAQRGTGIRRLHHASVNAGTVVVNRMNYLRDHRGSAYMPSLLPPGVKPTDLQ